MTVAELIEKLQKEPPDMPVFIHDAERDTSFPFESLEHGVAWRDERGMMFTFLRRRDEYLRPTLTQIEILVLK